MTEKMQKKIEKLDRQLEQAKKNISDSKQQVEGDMKKSYEDVELWKQKELAKGKDPERVERQYQRGLRALDRVEVKLNKTFDKMDTKIDDWNFKGRVKLEKSAHKKLFKKVASTSLAKMEKILSEDPNTELRHIIAGYCAIVKKEKVNEIKHPNLTKQIALWEDAIRKASKKNEYFKAFLSLIEDGDKKSKRLGFKKVVAERVNEILEKENLSIRFLSEYTKIKYANIYNFLKREIYTDLSFRRAHRLLWMTINIKNGYSREEAFLKYAEIIKNSYEIDGMPNVGDIEDTKD